MADKSFPDDKLPEAEAEARFKRLVGNLANTPHKPHKPKAGKESKTPDKMPGGVEKRGAESKPKRVQGG
jgi:hypothetical protein